MPIEALNRKELYAGTAATGRQIGLALGLGIFTMPLIFAWFLLRSGYGSAARFIGFGWLAFTLAAVFATPAARQNSSAETGIAERPATTEQASNSQATRFQPFEVDVAADPGVQYVIFNVLRRPDGRIEVASRRKGSSGTSYAKRLVNCQDWTFMYLAEGDTIKALSIPRPDPEMAPLTPGSSSTVITYHACRQAGLAS